MVWDRTLGSFSDAAQPLLDALSVRSQCHGDHQNPIGAISRIIIALRFWEGDAPEKSEGTISAFCRKRRALALGVRLAHARRNVTGNDCGGGAYLEEVAVLPNAAPRVTWAATMGVARITRSNSPDIMVSP